MNKVLGTYEKKDQLYGLHITVKYIQKTWLIIPKLKIIAQATATFIIP